MTENDFEVDVVEAIKKALSSENFEKIEITLDENSKETNQVLAKVSASKGGKAEDLHLAVKLGNGENAAEGFKRESYVLREVVPLFLDLQKYLRIQNPVTAFSKCYQILNQNTTQLIVLENLEERGYGKVTGDLNENNYKLVLKTIAKFHALSFALRHIHEEKFKEVLSNCHIVTKSMLEEVAQFFNSRLEKLKFNLKLRMRLDLLKKFEDALENFNGHSIIEILNDKVVDSVLIHGDYHQNSILLKYEGSNKENAADVALTGFQASGLHSPVIDISQYFFSSLGSGYFSNVRDFLQYYHEELASFLKELGCDVEEIFPYDKLLDHWQKYSFYGFCFTVAFLELGSLNLGKLSRDSKKEDEEVAAVLQKSLNYQKVENTGAYRRKLEKIVEGFLDSELQL